MRIWITGIAGFLGSHLAETLINQGFEVAGNDNLICGLVYNIPFVKYNAYARSMPYYELDCRETERLQRVMKSFKPDVVIHAAATAAEGFSVFSPAFITRNIYEASVSTFSAAIAAGAKRIITMSSMARYGKGTPPFTEDMPTNPIDPYGIAKVAAEQTLRCLAGTHGIKWSILVPHNIIGTRQEITPYRNVCTIFLNRLRLELPVYIYGDGEQKRSFSPVKDCLHSLVRAIHGDADGEVVNIGPDSNEISINELLTICERVTERKAERVYLPGRPVTDDVKEAYCSSDKARRLLGYESQQDIVECIREMNAALEPKLFDYSFPLEIESDKLPRTWKEKL